MMLLRTDRKSDDFSKPGLSITFAVHPIRHAFHYPCIVSAMLLFLTHVVSQESVLSLFRVESRVGKGSIGG